jgi:hypothetical protein
MTAQRYRITVRGRLSDHFGSAFEGLAVEVAAGETTLVGVLRDQAELHGVLERIRDFGLELLRVEREPASEAPDTQTGEGRRR